MMSSPSFLDQVTVTFKTANSQFVRACLLCPYVGVHEKSGNESGSTRKHFQAKHGILAKNVTEKTKEFGITEIVPTPYMDGFDLKEVEQGQWVSTKTLAEIYHIVESALVSDPYDQYWCPFLTTVNNQIIHRGMCLICGEKRYAMHHGNGSSKRHIIDCLENYRRTIGCDETEFPPIILEDNPYYQCLQTSTNTDGIYAPPKEAAISIIPVRCVFKRSELHTIVKMKGIVNVPTVYFYNVFGEDGKKFCEKFDGNSVFIKFTVVTENPQKVSVEISSEIFKELAQKSKGLQNTKEKIRAKIWLELMIKFSFRVSNLLGDERLLSLPVRIWAKISEREEAISKYFAIELADGEYIMDFNLECSTSQIRVKSVK